MPRHAVEQNGQRVEQVNELIQALAKEVFGHRHTGTRNSQEIAYIEYLFEILDL